MANELEEFLRRAAERRAAQKSTPASPNAPPVAPRPPTARPPVVARPPAADRPPPSSPKPAVRTLVAEVVPVETVAEVVPLAPVSGDDVAAHVARHLDTTQFNRRAQTLGEGAGRADDEMEAHLHQAFDHRLGKLAGPTKTVMADVSPASQPTEVSRPVASSLVTDLVAMFRNASSIRQAILVNEILNRPEQRW